MELKSYSPAKTVQKAFSLLELLAEKQPAKPAELAKQLNLPRSNLYRLLATLIKMGYVEETPDARYLLSFKVFILGNTVRGMNQLSILARPYMARLAEISEENVNLAILYENRVLYIDKIESKHYLKLDQPIGKTHPLHSTALGKVLLSGLDDPNLEVFLRSDNLISFTRNTITDPQVLAGVVRNVRRQGYAMDFEEHILGIHCLAAPIMDHTNHMIAAISISGPTIRLTKKKVEELKIPLIENALEISKKMGCTRFATQDPAEGR